MRHGLNLNLVHTWRRALDTGSSADFVRLPLPATREPDTGQSVTPEPPTVSIRLTAPQGTIAVDWPLSTINQSVAWLKALQGNRLCPETLGSPAPLSG